MVFHHLWTDSISFKIHTSLECVQKHVHLRTFVEEVMTLAFDCAISCVHNNDNFHQ